MAVLGAYPNIEVQIVCNGAPLKEYDDDDEESAEPNTVTKYVEVVSGAEFQIQHDIMVPWPRHEILFECTIDKQNIGGNLIKKRRYQGRIYRYTKNGALSYKKGQWSTQRFHFAELLIAETETGRIQDSLMNTLKNMGEIKVEAFHVYNLRPSRHEKESGSDLKEIGILLEKALKGKTLSHQAILGAKQPITVKLGSTDFNHLDPRKKPFATFIFKYRSRDALKSLMVVPRSPSPVPLEERDIATLTETEMRQLLQRQRERNVAAQQVKTERVKRERSATISGLLGSDDDDISFVSAKRRRLPVLVDENGFETIDLT